MKKLQKGESVKQNWKAINDLIDQAEAMQREITRLRTVVKQLEGSLSGDSPRFPFRVYSIPNSLRTGYLVEAWRTFYVQHGYCGDVQTDGCDDTDGEGTTPIEITVPDDQEGYLIWVEITLDESGAVTSAEIAHGADGWTDFPAQNDLPDTIYVLLAEVNTLQGLTEGEDFARVRQHVYQDIFFGPGTGGGGDSRWQ